MSGHTLEELNIGHNLLDIFDLFRIAGYVEVRAFFVFLHCSKELLEVHRVGHEHRGFIVGQWEHGAIRFGERVRVVFSEFIDEVICQLDSKKFAK